MKVIIKQNDLIGLECLTYVLNLLAKYWQTVNIKVKMINIA